MGDRGSLWQLSTVQIARLRGGESMSLKVHVELGHAGLQSMKLFSEKLRAGGHDYAGAKAAVIFAYCREQKPVFDGICDRAVTHAKQILSDQ